MASLASPTLRQLRSLLVRRVSLAGASFRVDANYDFARSTRDNYQAGPSDAGAADASSYAAIRAQLDAAYHGTYSRARRQFQDRLVDAVVDLPAAEPRSAPWIVFTAGAMGAGKTHVMDWLCERGVLPLMVPIDADLFKAALPEWAGYVSRDPLTAGFHTRRESGYLVELAQEASLRARQHVWVDGSLRDGEWYQQVFARIRARHPAYRIAILYVAADRDTVYRRIAARAEETGRHVPRAEVDDSLARVPKSVERLAAQVEFLAGIDNSTDAPQLRSYFCEADDLSRDVDLRAAADDDEWAPLRDHFADGSAPPPPVAPTLPPPGPRREPLTSKL